MLTHLIPADGLRTPDLDFDLRQRGNLADLDREFYAHWSLGQNLLLAWAPCPAGIDVLVVPHYTVARYGADLPSPDDPRAETPAHQFIMHLLSGTRQFSARQMANATRLLGVDAVTIPLRHPLAGSPKEAAAIEQLVKRYSVSYVRSRAVALFDIVGFGLLSPFDQMNQLNSLSCSLNAAHNRLLGRRMLVNFARSSTGDGFYIWNRDTGLVANTNLYHFMHLVLADNAIARQKAAGRGVPVLRTSFHVGSCYEFNHADGLNPTMHCDLVGDVTIELARMIDHALPGQILVGEFRAPLHAGDEGELDAVRFLEQAQGSLSQLNGLELSGDAVESIKCYLTGEACVDGTFTVRRLAIEDKHGLRRNAFNAKVNIHRRGAAPILLGIEDRELRGRAAPPGPLPTDG
ncbi:MAG: hypothetical protein J0M16_04600 [Gammaproteobacteria bacterium]|jgi:hypothetical protein|nr:hypothetical protein [Gammaproteobacteria bacterium]